MPDRRGNYKRLGRPLAAAGLLVLLCATAGTSVSRTAGASELVGYGSSMKQPQLVPGAQHTAPGTNAAGPSVSSFSISGNVSGLYPGVTRPLVLKVANPQKVAITVTSIKTAVSTASATCVAANVKVSSFSGQLHIAAGAKTQVTVQVTMSHGAPNSCQGAVFQFHYSSVGTEV
jgi:hypothetical protein